MEKDLVANTQQTWQTKLAGCQQSVEVLREELALTTAILNTISALVLVCDPQGYIVRCNCAWERIAGYKFDEVRNQPFWELFFTPQEKETVKAAFEKVRVDKLVIAHENDWITKDGSRHRIAWSYTPFFAADGTLKYAIATGNDITATKCLEAERQRSEAELHRLEVTLAVQLTRLAEEARQAAITKQQEKAARARVAELSKANDALKRMLDTVATEPELERFLGHVLLAIAQQFNAPMADYWWHGDNNIAYPRLIAFEGQLFTPEELDHPCIEGFPVPPAMIHGEAINYRRQHFITEDFAISPFIPKNIADWFIQRGVHKEINVPMTLGDKTFGALVVRLSCKQQITDEQIELAHALAHQASLAVQLTQLAEQAKQAAILKEQEKAAQERAAALDRMNKALQAEVRERQRAEQVSRGQTETLARTLTVLVAEPVLDNFLGYVLQAIAEQLGDQSGGIYLYNEECDTTILHINYENGQIERGTQITHPGASTQNPPRQWDAQYMPLLRQKQILIHDERDFTKSPVYDPYRKNNAQRGIKTILVVPLLFGDTFLGNITLRSTQRRDYKPEELELARVLAYQATLALQLTRLAEQAQQSAVLEERNRIAREIHDTLAQTLTGIVVQLQAAQDIHTTDSNDRQAHIAAARFLAKEGLTEARRSVGALRPQALEDTDLIGALVNLIEQMATGNGIQAVCHARGTPYFLPPVVESNLLRIGQEAFTNALKHSQASEIQIELVYQPEQVQLWVQDNGQGFDPDLLPNKGYGLLSMRERAQKIGADLTITSRFRYGTEVAITVPVFSLSSQRSSA